MCKAAWFYNTGFKMSEIKEFANSTNGDRWFLTTDEVTQQAIVLHRGNPASGGHETKTPVQQFLNTRPFGPEREALMAAIGASDDRADDAQDSYTSSSI